MKKNLSKGYLEYIQSPKWRKKRLMALIHYGEICDKCGAKKRLDVHHLTYERFGKELLADLQILCRTCHDAVHAIQDQQKPNKKVKTHKPSKRKNRVNKQIFKFNPNIRANRKLKKSKQRKLPVGSTIVLQIRNPDPTSPHTLPARLRNK